MNKICQKLLLFFILLKQTKINVHAKNYGGNTALHIAKVKDSKIAKELVELLIKHGADSDLRSNNDNQEKGGANEEEEELDEEDQEDEQEHTLLNDDVS